MRTASQVPKKTKDLAETLALLRAHAEASTAPVIVHCSAGVGRTGALLAADIGIDTVTSGGRADMTDILSNLRWHRGGMITACVARTLTSVCSTRCCTLFSTLYSHACLNFLLHSLFYSVFSRLFEFSVLALTPHRNSFEIMALCYVLCNIVALVRVKTCAAYSSGV